LRPPLIAKYVSQPRETEDLNFALQVTPAGRIGEDRAAVFPITGGHLVVVADGAGGTSGGAASADAVLSKAGAFVPMSVTDCVQFLTDLDVRLRAIGQTTAVVASVANGHVIGASVGDSGAWVLSPSDLVDLTEEQNRKPLLGSGLAKPVGFGPCSVSGRLLVASDGLFNYVALERIRELATTLPLASTASALVDAARLPSGVLRDDVAVIVAG
jgi:serine/threonine protein phosphatase PrpC